MNFIKPQESKILQQRAELIAEVFEKIIFVSILNI